MNRGSTAGQPRVNRGFCSSIGLHRISPVRAPGGSFRRRVFDALEGTREACLLARRTVLLASSPARPHPATPPCAPTRPARGMSGFRTRQVYQEFRRTEPKSDAAAYSNLENIRCGSGGSSLESFITMWENLMLTFRTPPSDDHLFTPRGPRRSATQSSAPKIEDWGGGSSIFGPEARIWGGLRSSDPRRTPHF